VAGIAAEIEKVAPKAILLNYLNPSNVVTEAIAHSSGIRVIGLSDSPRLSVQMLAQRAGAITNPAKRLIARTVGLTHGNWTTSVWHEGSDILPTIVSWCKEYINHHPEMTLDNYDQVMLARLTADYEAIPSYYMHYYYFPEIVLEFLKRKPTTRTEDIMSILPQLRAYYQEDARKDVPHLLPLPGDYHRPGNFTLQILRSILNDTGEEWVVGVPNNGSLNFLDDDRIVEVPCRVDARGATPLAQGDGGLAINQTGLIALLAEYEGATARAALWGTRRDAIKALASNPLVMSYSKAEQIYDELAAVHANYLPERLLK
jgi:6-phospho-beta-glucosidase